MKTIILCGGRGTRLQQETEYRPKPLVNIGGRPILWHIMKLYANYGFHDFVLCLGYKGEMIKEYFLNYKAMSGDFTISCGKQDSITYHDIHQQQDFSVTLADTGSESMTGARIKRVEQYVDGDTLMVTYGDGVADLDIKKLVEFHEAHNKLATVTAVRPTSRFGVLSFDSAGTVEEFAEKPEVINWASAGFFIFDRRVFDYLRVEPDCILEREPLERLAREGQLMAFPHDGFFFAMDTYRDYLHLNELWRSGKAPWAVWREKQ